MIVNTNAAFSSNETVHNHVTKVDSKIAASTINTCLSFPSDGKITRCKASIGNSTDKIIAAIICAGFTATSDSFSNCGASVTV